MGGEVWMSADAKEKLAVNARDPDNTHNITQTEKTVP